jgi:DNA-binding NarL/FixJ family response regulator
MDELNSLYIRALIIEDDFFACDALASRLQRDRYIRVSAEIHSTQEALLYLSSHSPPPHVILLDLDFPDQQEHGLELLQCLKTAHSIFYICCLTLRQDINLIQTAFAMGSDGILFKNECADSLGLAISHCAIGDFVTTPSIAPLIDPILVSLPAAKQRNVFIPPSIYLPADMPAHLRKVAYMRYVRGLTTDQIAEELSLSLYTIDDYLKQIKLCLDLPGRSLLLTRGFIKITRLLWKNPTIK